MNRLLQHLNYYCYLTLFAVKVYGISPEEISVPPSYNFAVFNSVIMYTKGFGPLSPSVPVKNYFFRGGNLLIKSKGYTL